MLCIIVSKYQCSRWCVCVFVFVCVCMYVCTYARMYVYMCIYIYIYIYIYKNMVTYLTAQNMDDLKLVS